MNADNAVGEVKVTDGIHPEALGIAGTFGAEAEGSPIAKCTGVHFNSLIPVDMKHTDPMSGGLDSCVRAKVTRVKSSKSNARQPETGAPMLLSSVSTPLGLA